MLTGTTLTSSFSSIPQSHYLPVRRTRWTLTSTVLLLYSVQHSGSFLAWKTWKAYWFLHWCVSYIPVLGLGGDFEVFMSLECYKLATSNLFKLSSQLLKDAAYQMDFLFIFLSLTVVWATLSFYFYLKTSFISKIQQTWNLLEN